MLFGLIITSLFLSSSLIEASYLEYDGWLNVELFHAIDKDKPDQFTRRGNITVTSLNTGVSKINQEPLSTEDAKKLVRLAEAGQLYRLRVVVAAQDGTRTEFYTSTKSCALANAHLNDVLWLSLDHSGSVIAVTQTIGGTGNCGSLSRISADSIEEFNTEVFVKHAELAPVPDTVSFIQKVERERIARETGEINKDNRGFFAKYWMYIVPVVILLLVSGATNPDGGGAAAGGGR